MIVVGDNLAALNRQYGIVATPDCFEETSLALRLDSVVTRLVAPSKDALIDYEQTNLDTWARSESIETDGLTLPPKACVLSCSRETVTIPQGYMGFVETKGSLARLFVLIHCSDPQLDSGYSGKVTFEICNLGENTVRIRSGRKVAQLFLFKATTSRVGAYAGLYQGATKPTIAKPHP